MRNFSSIVWGLFLIALGGALLGDKLGYFVFDFGRFLHTWWPLVLIIVGLGIAFDHPHERNTK